MAVIISRAEAMALGLARYFTGKPCGKGHVAERYVVGHHCVECDKLHRARPEIRARKNEQHRQWRQTPRGKAAMKAENALPHRRTAMRDRVRVKRAKLWSYAPPPLERDCPPRPSDGRCDCCLKPAAPPRWLSLDHDHETGAFRGWICNSCNTGRGIADDPAGLRTRADFLDGNLPWQ